MDTTTEQMMTVDQVASLFGVHPRTVIRWVDQRDMPHFRPSEGVIRFSRQKVLDWASSGKDRAS